MTSNPIDKLYASFFSHREIPEPLLNDMFRGLDLVLEDSIRFLVINTEWGADYFLDWLAFVLTKTCKRHENFEKGYEKEKAYCEIVRAVALAHTGDRVQAAHILSRIPFVRLLRERCLFHSKDRLEAVHKLRLPAIASRCPPHAIAGLKLQVDSFVERYNKIRTWVTAPYIRIPFKLAKGLPTGDIQFHDNLQFGMYGLLHAVSTFVVGRSSFGSYVYTWCRNTMYHNMKESLAFIRMPSGTMDRYSRIKQYLEDLSENKISVDEVMDQTGLTRKEIEHVLYCINVNKITPLSVRVKKNDGMDNESITYNVDTVIDDSVIDKLDDSVSVEVLQSYLAKLRPDERIAFCVCAGLFEELPPHEIGKKEMNRERIRQLVAIYSARKAKSKEVIHG